MTRIAFIIGVTFLTVLLSSCNETTEQKESEYDATKKMVIDIFQTDEGKKALKDLLTDEELKQELVIESEVVQESIEKVLVSEKGHSMWKDLFNDPSFIEGFANSMKDEQEELMKRLMNDAEFQEQMIDLLKNPQINEQMLDLMKSQQFRSHLEETITQTLETPLFQIKMTELLLKAAEEQNKSEEQEKSGSEQEQGEENGGEDTEESSQ